MALDVSGLSVPDAVVALRSFPRRYGELLRSFEGDDNIEAMARRVSPDGTSAMEATEDTVRTFGLLGQALQQVLVRDQPVVHAGVLATRVIVHSWRSPSAYIRSSSRRSPACVILGPEAGRGSRAGSTRPCLVGTLVE